MIHFADFAIGLIIGVAGTLLTQRKPRNIKTTSPWNPVKPNMTKSIAPPYTGPSYGYFRFIHLPPNPDMYSAGEYDSVSVCGDCHTIAHHVTSGWPGACGKCGHVHLPDTRTTGRWEPRIGKWILANKNLTGVFPSSSDTISTNDRE